MTKTTQPSAACFEGVEQNCGAVFTAGWNFVMKSVVPLATISMLWGRWVLGVGANEEGYHDPCTTASPL